MATIFKRGGRDNKRGYFYAAWIDYTGRPRSRSTRTVDRDAAQLIANELEKQEALRRDGIVDPAIHLAAEQSRRPIREHLKAYEAKLRASDLSAYYVSDTLRMIGEICDAAGFAKAANINTDSINQFVVKLKDDPSRSAARTRQKYLTAICGFTRWLHNTGKLPLNPLATIKKPQPTKEQLRRMLLPDEWLHLAAAAANGPVRYGMAAGERALLYRTAIETGLRERAAEPDAGQRRFRFDTALHRRQGGHHQESANRASVRRCRAGRSAPRARAG